MFRTSFSIATGLGLVIIGLVLMVPAAWVHPISASLATSKPTEVNFEPIEVVMGRVEARVFHDYSVTVRNNGPAPVRIAGISELCTLQGCILAPELPGSIPARGSVAILLRFKANRIGRVDIQITLYLVEPQHQGRRIPISIRGEVVPARNES